MVPASLTPALMAATFFTARQELLVTLLVRVGMVAALASILIRFNLFRALLFRDSRTMAARLKMGAFFGVIFGLGVAVRVALGYKAPDLSLEGALLAGLFGGYIAGALAAGLMALPAMLNGEFVALPWLVAVGLAGGVARHLAPDLEGIWHFSPFIDMNIYRWYQKRFGKPRGDWQLMFFFFIVVLQIAYIYLGRGVHGHVFYYDRNGRPVTPTFLFYLDSTDNWLKFAMIAAAIACVAIPIKIWNSTRNEIIVEEQRRLLTEARLAALTSQINPHFLFNTLNSISSLVRIHPEMARVTIHKLSSILRRLLRRQEAFSTLAEELDFIDDYLDIEVIRFGEQKLRIVKEVAGETLHAQVPSMLLQPLVENSIKHGLSRRLDQGEIRIRSRFVNESLHIEVEDNGTGMVEEAPASGESTGIGLANVQERLRVLYGSGYVFRISGQPGQGTCVHIELPEVATAAVTATHPGEGRVGGASLPAS